MASSSAPSASASASTNRPSASVLLIFDRKAIARGQDVTGAIGIAALTAFSTAGISTLRRSFEAQIP